MLYMLYQKPSLYLHGIGEFISTNTLQNEHLLEVVQVRIPVPRQWLPVRLYAVKYLLKSFGVLAELFS